jgi:hypothetical protein
VIGRPLDDQLKLECLYGYSIMGDPEIVEGRDAFVGLVQISSDVRELLGTALGTVAVRGEVKLQLGTVLGSSR